MTTPTDLDLARIVKPLTTVSVKGEVVEVHCLEYVMRYSDNPYYVQLFNDRHTARVLAALDTDALRQMIADAVAAEREACARIAENTSWDWVYDEPDDDEYERPPDPEKIAAAIRARGEA